jgi:GTP-binding protein Era
MKANTTNSQNQQIAIIALIGEPNAGKSTLLNALVGEEIAAVTHKVQTTRTTMKGVVNTGNSQLIFIDTPGIFKPERSLERQIVKNAWVGLDSADMACLILDASKPLNENIQIILEKLKRDQVPSYVIINKIDKVSRERLLKLAAELQAYEFLQAVFMISALKKKGLDTVLRKLAEVAPEGKWLFKEDDITDTPIRTIAEEMTRKHAFQLLHQEIPYSLKVETEKWEEDEAKKTIKIYQAITVMNEQQKRIVIGKGASKIKLIGQAARNEITALTGSRVALYLHAKVKPWIE